MNVQFKPKVKVNFLIENVGWKRIRNLKPLTLAILTDTLNQINYFALFEKAEITIKFADDVELLALNNTYLNKPKPTNVLSFPFYEAKEGKFKLLNNNKKLYLGDIALSYTTIYNESLEQEKLFEHHFTHLLIHGLLHLCGYDHNIHKKAKRMETLEIKILKLFNIMNPY